MDLKKEIVNLYIRTATELLEDITSALEKAKVKENNRISKKALLIILENINKAKSQRKPICQDTGAPIFYIEYPKTYSQKYLKKIINEATTIATKKIPLRSNEVDSLTNKILKNKPVIYFEESNKLRIDLMLKGGGSENVSAIYQLPNKEINASRDLDGVKKCILDAVFEAQGKGCPPYILGVAIGGNIEQVAHLSKKQLLRKINDVNYNLRLRDFERKLLKEINKLNIGPLGLGGKTTALSVKIASASRHPASFFVGISVGCWCLRRQKL